MCPGGGSTPTPTVAKTVQTKTPKMASSEVQNIYAGTKKRFSATSGNTNTLTSARGVNSPPSTQGKTLTGQ